MLNTCVFCGAHRKKLTEEHVFGDWICEFYRQLFGSDLLGTIEFGNTTGDSREFRGVPFQQKVRIVCGKCNNGWMADLEGSVIPYLKRMLIGEPAQLRANAQRNLARWCVKTALVLEYLNPHDRLIPQSHFSELYHSAVALDSSFVVISSRSIPRHAKGLPMMQAMRERVVYAQVESSAVNGDVSVAQEKLSEWATDGRVVYKVIFAVGRFVAQVFGHDLPATMGVMEHAPPATTIWPDVTNRMTWDTSKSVDSVGGLIAFHRKFAVPPHGADVPDDYYTNLRSGPVTVRL